MSNERRLPDPADIIHPDTGSWWWMSFCDPDLPKGQQFLGVAIVRGVTLPAAIKRAWELQLNPGGEVQSYALPDEHVPPEPWRERLLNRLEVNRLNAEMATRPTT